MNKFYTFLMIIIASTAVCFSQSQLTVNTSGGQSDSYEIVTIKEMKVVDNVVSVESIAFSDAEISLMAGSVHQVEFTIMPENATNKNVTWTSSNSSVATVNEFGLITAVAEGNAIITAETEDGNKSDEINVVVTPLTSVEFADNNIKVYPNPVQNILQLDMGDVNRYEVIVSDMSGNILLSQFDKNQIDFSQFASGNYFLTLVINNNYYNYKIIKN
ncbi:MAG: Ig-like domain-containing protein [Chlorobiota bacterium]